MTQHTKTHQRKPDIPTIAQLTKIVRPARNGYSFLAVCANYRADMIEAYEDGHNHYEISGLNTKSGRPEVFWF